MTSFWTANVTNEGAEQHTHSGDPCVEFFAKAGSLYVKAKSYYKDEATSLSLFQEAFGQEDDVATRLLFWLRNPRGGAGNRSGFRDTLRWMALNYPEYIKPNIRWIPHFGRWDDLRALFNTPLEDDAADFWARAIDKEDVLAAKWADRTDWRIRKRLGLKVGEFRRKLASIRSQHIVESKMCENKWDKIEYQTVPSVAMSRYTNAFQKHDPDGFMEFKNQVETGEKTVHADVLFPHDCVRTARFGDKQMADAQFNALPNFMSEDEMIMVIADSSASMGVHKAGSVTAMDISMGMALYCSSKVSEDHPFYKRFIAFCSEGRFVDWRGMKFSDAVNNHRVFDGAIGSTRIDKALATILDIALEKNIEQRLMPTTLLIVSDMQFSSGVREGQPVRKALQNWVDAGYKKPKIVYWNTSGYAGSPEIAIEYDAGLVSGFSPSILKAIFNSEDFSPRGIMLKTLEDYSMIEIP